VGRSMPLYDFLRKCSEHHRKRERHHPIQAIGRECRTAGIVIDTRTPPRDSSSHSGFSNSFLPFWRNVPYRFPWTVASGTTTRFFKATEVKRRLEATGALPPSSRGLLGW
jgi:hypothetical protein